MIGRTIALAFLLATPALAQNHNRVDIVRGLCRPDGCDEFAILGTDEIAATHEGTLLRTLLKTFHASRDGRRDLGEEQGYVFCSPTKPAIMATQDGQTMAFYLAPFAIAESRETVRRNANYHAVYFALCHGPDAGRAAVADLSSAARDLGYRVPLERSKLVSFNRAEDILASSERRPVIARRDEPPLPPAAVPSAEIRRDPRFVERHAPPAVAKEEGLLSAPRRFTNRAIDALDELGGWMFGR